MGVKLYTFEGVQTSLLASTLGNIPNGDFILGRYF